MAERAQWRRDVYSWKGSWSDVPSPHALSYYTDNPFLRDEVNDLCVVCTPAGKAESAKKYAVRTEVKPVGVLAGFRVFDVLYYLGERGQGAPAAPKWKSILVEVGPDSLQEIFHLQASRVPVSLKPSSIVQSGGERVLVSMDRDGGNGGGCWEGYWWFDRDGPHRLDFSGLEAAIKNQLPEGVIAQVSCSNLNLGEQIVRSWVRKIQPECRTCDVIGEVTARYRLNGASVVPIEVKFRLTEPRLEQNLSVGKSAGDALRADRSSNRHPQARYLKSILYHEARLRPALRAWLTDRENGDAARYLLALIGEPEDLRLALSIAPPLTEDNDNRWASSVACARPSASSNAPGALIPPRSPAQSEICHSGNSVPHLRCYISRNRFCALLFCTPHRVYCCTATMRQWSSGSDLRLPFWGPGFDSRLTHSFLRGSLNDIA